MDQRREEEITMEQGEMAGVTGEAAIPQEIGVIIEIDLAHVIEVAIEIEEDRFLYHPTIIDVALGDERLPQLHISVEEDFFFFPITSLSSVFSSRKKSVA
ncbi:hypothetical protein CSUI_011020 [Cystoisospora suis]|uniref:Uncharacterized protein n=1 Tax=Cystoisospora suis TaxID=483139 RepID=A0A2C6KD63_9APIC|nr:hypothetical protein CSUI_011020 [Cystoisospora suis]